MDNNTANQNAELITSLSIGFCLVNGLNPVNMAQPTAEMVIALVACWYEERGLAFDPATDTINPDALKMAFDSVQRLTDALAVLSEKPFTAED